MDPFEVRMRFTTSLQHLNASVTSAQRAANYALRHRDMQEDLHSCILEQLEKNNMNNRANIMYFIEHLCDMSMKEGQHEYIRMLQRDMYRVIDAVAPADGSGAANVKVARRVLNALAQKEILSQKDVQDMDECLKERDIGTSDIHGDLNSTSTPQGGRANGAIRVDKRQIEQRIEEDRERHKRLRESIWAVSGQGDNEFDKLWDDAETSDIDEDDEVHAVEDAELRHQAVEFG